jgi:tRNA threonylcarbamoyladenosine biosynthesis protein TsaE
MNAIVISNIDDLQRAVAFVLKHAKHSKKILLYGDMGAGKTTFTKALCQHFGVEGNTSSPTYSLVNSYRYTDVQGNPQTIHHLDLYRLKTTEEALDIGIEDYLYDPNYCLIEWPQIIESLLPDDVVKIRIELLDKFERKIVIL